MAVVQDCRGKFASEGSFTPYNNEGQDGYDTIEWIVAQPWANGRVGMWGASYVGATQWQAAVEEPPGLVTITPTATFTSFYRNLYLGGAVRHSLISTWAAGNSPKPAGAVVNNDWQATLLHLPLGSVDEKIGWPIGWLKGIMNHPSPGGYWKRLDMTADMPGLKLPMQHVVGVYDFFARESVGNFVRMQTQARDPQTRKAQQLIFGPWDHGTIGKAKVGDLDFGPAANWDPTAATLAWFNITLKSELKTDQPDFVPVRYFIMGENKWHNAETWPPARYTQTAFYLHSGGKANTLAGDGRLSTTAPMRDEPADHFSADPANPVPACPPDKARPIQAGSWAPLDQRPLEQRPDVLVYSTAPLEKPLTFAGDARAELYVSASTPDADWVVKLVDVHPDGPAYNLTVGILRGRFRDSEMKPSLLKPGEVYKINVDLGPIAARILPGHRLRVDICGAYFPLFDRNPNTVEGIFGTGTATAVETIFHTPGRESRIILPVSQEK